MTQDTQDNGPLENTVENNEVTITRDANNISDRIRGILFGSEQEEQQPEGSEQTGEVQTEDKVDQGLESVENSHETEENPQAEDGEDQVHSQISESTDEDGSLPNGVQKRINKLTARNKDYEEKITDLESKLSELEQKVVEKEQVKTEPEKVVGENPFSNLDTVDKINAELENARWLRFKCEENPDGFELGDSYLNADEVRKVKVNALRAMEEHLPKQAQFIQAHQEFKQVATKEYPWYSKPETKEYQLANEVLRNFPQFRRYPDFQLFVGDYVRGYMSRTNTRAPQASVKPAPSLSVRPRTSPTQATRKESGDKNTMDAFVKSGGREGLARILLSKGII